METLNKIIKECQNRDSKCSLKRRNKPQTHIHKMNPKEKKVLIKKNKIIMNLQISGIVRIFALKHIYKMEMKMLIKIIVKK
jgi:hypothetical protein